MPTQKLQTILSELAHHYNTPEFILSDPVQFPHRYSDKKDIEISAVLTSWISWGNRKQIIRTAQHLDDNIMAHHPMEYLQSRRWEEFHGMNVSFYRTAKYHDLYLMLQRLYEVYQTHTDLEAHVVQLMEQQSLNPAQALSRIFGGITGVADAEKGSPCKRLWFLLRWLVRQDGIVDLGIWQRISPASLVIPLDTHVHHVALTLGLTTRRTADIVTAQEITQYFQQIFPHDPALGDFALFGYGIEHGI